MAVTSTRHCTRCGARLARDNQASAWSACDRDGRSKDQAPRMDAEFWATDQMADALVSRDMGVVVRAYRHHPAHGGKPLKQVIMGQWLGVTQGQLSRIESGHIRVRDLDRLIDYARRLRIPAEQLWFDVGADHPDVAGPALGVCALPDGPVVSAAAARTEPALAEALLETLDQYAIADNLAGAQPLLNVVPQQIAFIDRLLDGSRGRTRARLLYVAARFAEFAGWLNQDAGDLHAAMRWSNNALDFAVEAGDSGPPPVVRRPSQLGGGRRSTCCAGHWAAQHWRG